MQAVSTLCQSESVMNLSVFITANDRSRLSFRRFMALDIATRLASDISDIPRVFNNGFIVGALNISVISTIPAVCTSIYKRRRIIKGSVPAPVHTASFLYKTERKTSVFVKVFTLICTKTPQERRFSKKPSKAVACWGSFSKGGKV